MHESTASPILDRRPFSSSPLSERRLGIAIARLEFQLPLPRRLPSYCQSATDLHVRLSLSHVRGARRFRSVGTLVLVSTAVRPFNFCARCQIGYGDSGYMNWREGRGDVERPARGHAVGRPCRYRLS
jgi:hypothetical protein